MKSKLARLEARLQALIEGSAARFFPAYTPSDQLANQIVDAMRANLYTSAEGVAIAPNLYSLLVSPGQYTQYLQDRKLIDGLTQILRESGQEANIQFAGPPVVRVEADPALNPNQVRIQARNSLRDLPTTTNLPVTSLDAQAEIPPNAFLIVNGVSTFPLESAVINIGRRSDNQLVIADARVSRVHAQLRAMRGRYILFDLDSSGGTLVNGERIRQHLLYPGDVISLSGVPLVFGQDPIGFDETQDFIPGEGDRLI
ncbi:MAG TPA: FhaA domain-containing protein [Anaerolineales bacterium]|nr:FhaA domain-containing protein [Anaerolineales bacterium]